MQPTPEGATIYALTPSTIENQPEGQSNATEQTSDWMGRTVKLIPVSHDGADSSKAGGGFCCCIAICCIITGGVLWGVCVDPSKDGCNDAMKTAGQALVGIGAGIIAANVCCLAAVCCLASGAACLNPRS